MNQLQFLLQFIQKYDETNKSLHKYSISIENIFLDSIETNQTLFDQRIKLFEQYKNDLQILTNLLNKENEIINFFNKCKEHKQKLITVNNSIITTLLKWKKKNCTSIIEYQQFEEEWNNKRIETIDEKNRRKVEELLEEIQKTKKNYIN